MSSDGKRSEAWAAENARRIDKRIIVEGDLVLETPAHFGAGDADDLTDMPLLVAGDDARTPLLTGATIAGALRAYLYAREKGYRAPAPRNGEGHQSLTYALFGAFKGDDDGVQSPLIVEDAFGGKAQIELRDGVKIKGSSRTAFAGGLFDMELWAAGTTFPLRFELDLIRPRRKRNADGSWAETEEAHRERVEEEQKLARLALATALEGLRDGSITLGARKRRGFGRARVAEWRVKVFDMHVVAALCDWIETGHRPLSEETGADSVGALSEHPYFKDVAGSMADRREWFEIDAWFKLDGSLLIRSSGQAALPEKEDAAVPARPDMVHLHNSAGKAVLPGTSVAGALRARAVRIMRLLHPEESARAWVDSLFGTDLHEADDYQRKEDIAASLLTVEERPVNGIDGLVQNRVAIDRFTGGARDTALFSEQPVWGDGAEDGVRICMRLVRPGGANGKKLPGEAAADGPPQPHFRGQAGLLLLLLKDLWTGDLPLGGEVSVGRGRLAGVRATVRHCHPAENGEEITTVDEWEIVQADDGLAISDEGRAALEGFVSALHGRAEEKAA